MARIIGISGYARSGKDTFFNVIKMFNPTFERVAFADLLKEELKERIEQEFGLDVYTQVTEQKNKFRHIMVEHGAGRRAEDPEYWLKSGLKKAEELIEKGLTPVITDVRYKNEAEAIIKSGGIVISLHRQGFGPPNEEERRSIKEILMMDDLSMFDYEWDEDFCNEHGDFTVNFEILKGVNTALQTFLKDHENLS